MTLRLHDTATRGLREFSPLVPGRVSIYVCGATVQASPHIGHLRSAVDFDVLRRWLVYSGFEVTFVRNVTDIDDKILHNAGHEGLPWWALAARHEREFLAGYDRLGCLPSTVEPRATGHVPAMVELIARLIEAGHAYSGADGVYFDVRSWAPYGELSRQRPDDLLAADVHNASGKRDPLDFALWKAAKPGEPSWPTPWGRGRPGWHLECSAMSTYYLGSHFDIHGGGVDLLFPHHENELAQSRAAGDAFARHWLHNGLVTAAGEKMSKSLGNSLRLDQVLAAVRPVELRYYLAGAHYRSHLEFSHAALSEAAAAYRRIEGFLLRTAEIPGRSSGPTTRGEGQPAPGGPAPGGPSTSRRVPEPFAVAMDEDLGTPAALAVLHETVRLGNRALDADDQDTAAASAAAVHAMTAVLGVDPASPPWSASAPGGAGGQASGADPERLRVVVDELVGLALAQRAQARARKDFPAADEVRDRLRRAGVLVEDTPHGARWSLGVASGNDPVHADLADPAATTPAATTPAATTRSPGGR